MNDQIQKLYVAYGPMVHRRSLSILKNDQRAYDVTQEVFLKLIENPGIVDRMRSPVSYLYRMSTNYSLNALKKDRRLAIELSDSIDGVIDTSESGIGAEALFAELAARLPEKTRLIAYCRFVDGMELREIAELTGMSLSGVRKQLGKFTSHAGKMKERIA
jgi:RNA polymerase sigma-70 factor (ECF subfamily)